MIHRPSIDDLPKVVQMIEQYYIENQRTKGDPVNFDLDQVIDRLVEWIQDPNALFLVSDDRGVIMGRLGISWFGDNLFAEQLILYVKPEFRNGIVAKNLIDAFNKDAKERGARAVIAIMVAGMNVDTIEALYRGLGWERQGGVYLKWLVPKEMQGGKIYGKSI